METKRLPARGWNPWPVGIVVFFGMAIIGCVTLVAFCSMHPSELVAPDYYEQELRFQARMDSQKHALQLGPQASITYDPRARVISVMVPGPESNPSGTIQLYRPSAAGLDRQMPLKLDPDGRQSISATELEPGLWKVRVSWRVGDRDYFLDERVIVDPVTGPPTTK